MKVFVTGTAGFIGFHLASRMLADGHMVRGFDGLTPYYDVNLKHQRHELLRQSNRFGAVEALMEDAASLRAAIEDFEPEVIVHLAAQAGVRYSIDHPDTYIGSNLVGTFNLLEAARSHRPRHLLIASTSSIYGGNVRMPFEEADRTDFPVSLYAATKKACEAISHSYAHLFAIPTTCFRFFTVYGPWGRPDMALFRFAEAIRRDQPIDVYGNGQMKRDFTFVDDLIESIVRLIDAVPQVGAPVLGDGVTDSLSPVAPWRSVNIAGGHSVELMDFIAAMEVAMAKRALKNMLPMQLGDVPETLADTRLLQLLTGYVPHTDVKEGVAAFVRWYQDWQAASC
jgi:UDP-glucuronate 4-epimerase